MRRLFGWLSRRHWLISLPLVVVAGLVAYLAISGLLDWANSTGFCGTTCHSMTPEYTAYQASFHARVRCVECHVGPGLWAEVQAKWQGVRELWLYVTNTWERPIPSPVENLRPARETCEQCHWPEVFYSDRSVAIVHYAQDGANTRSDTYMLVKIGGGTSRQGLGKGIHWHIENPMEYIATDPQRQNIPWVRAQINGQTVTFVDTTQPIPSADLSKYQVRVMDCIDCHNRATHIFRSATEGVESAMANGLLPADLLYLRRYAVGVMEGRYQTEAEAMTAIAGLADFYKQNYPDVYSQRAADIDQAIQVIQALYRSTHFPDYRVTSATYPSNIGHSDSPGCFRCHDGKHVAQDGSSIRLHCNICHTIPQTVVAGQPAPEIPFQPAISQPDSHLASNWIADHRAVADASCATCHQMQTFCANPNCHGRSWPYVNLNAVNPPYPLPQPGATPVPSVPPTAVPAGVAEDVQRGAALFATNCVACHPQAGRLDQEDLRETVLQGRGEMPAFPFSDAQVGDLAAFINWSAAHPGEPVPAGPAGPAPSFSTDILPVLQAKCGASCHSAATATAGFKAVDYAGVAAKVTPGNPDDSRLVQIQRGQHPGKLTTAELDLVIAWIKAGAPDN